MIENSNASKTASNVEYVDIRKYIGVASVNVLAINPNNDRLRKYGWSIPEDAAEPVYVTTDSSGRKSARVRFLVQIQDLEEKPVIAMDFWVRPDPNVNKDGTKCQIIDSYGRTAYGTKEEIKAHQVPQYANGLASIAPDYKICHIGEADIVSFAIKYLNITPLQIFDRTKKDWIPSKNPGRLTIDRWNSLSNGDVSELKEYFSLQPDNCVKVVLGVRTTEDNKTYQTFLSSVFIGNGASVDRNTGEYSSARKAIDKFYEYHQDSPYSFSAMPVKEWKETATAVEDKSQTMFDADGNLNLSDGDDLPFGDM